jgi:hypothetical protein
VSIEREDLERLTSAATAHVAFQRVAEQSRIAVPDIEATIDGHVATISAAAMRADLAELEETVIRTRRLLGWRR